MPTGIVKLSCTRVTYLFQNNETITLSLLNGNIVLSDGINFVPSEEVNYADGKAHMIHFMRKAAG